MTRPRPTFRVRLTLLYTALFATFGAIVVATTFGLVAGLPQTVDSTGVQPDQGGAPSGAFQQGVDQGTQRQRPPVPRPRTTCPPGCR